MICKAEGCIREAKRGGLCWGHVREAQAKRNSRDRRRRTSRMDGGLEVRHQSPWDCLTEAALAYADADPRDDAAFYRAKQRLKMAARRLFTTPRKSTR